jgi:putative PIN family toxin of toxin-antitoxin system
MTAPRVVLGTNCLVSALIFSRGSLAWLREAWQAKHFIPLASRETVSELLRVFHYPKFKLGREEQEMLLAEFLPYIETVKTETAEVAEASPENLPAIRDANDVMFLVLAEVAKADALVSGDNDVLAVKSQFHIPILTVAEFADWLEANRSC